jgi:hypothetical protein
MLQVPTPGRKRRRLCGKPFAPLIGHLGLVYGGRELWNIMKIISGNILI